MPKKAPEENQNTKALTAKQEGAAVDHVVNKMTQADAYRNNYNVENMTDKSIHEAASVLFADTKVSSRVKELKGQIQKKLEVTMESQVEEYRKIFEEVKTLMGEDGARTTQSYDLALKALTRVDKICGLEQSTKTLKLNNDEGSSGIKVEFVKSDKE
jgi:hypothetical protein